MKLSIENRRALQILKLTTEIVEENERYREALELIAGGTTDKLQAMQARAALDNIGAKS